MSTTREPFEPENWYHIFNHARVYDKLFESDLDFNTFLELVLEWFESKENFIQYHGMKADDIFAEKYNLD